MFPSPVILGLALLTGSDSADGQVVESATDRVHTSLTNRLGSTQAEVERSASPDDAAAPAIESGPMQIDGVDGWRVVVGPYGTWDDCHSKLNVQLEQAVAEYLDGYLEQRGYGQRMHVDWIHIRRDLLVGEPKEEKISSRLLGDMCQLTAVLRFDREFLDQIDRRWVGMRTQARLMQVALFSGAAFLLLATVYGYLKLDTATRGQYVRRLKFAAVTVILALIVAGVLIARWIPWI